MSAAKIILLFMGKIWSHLGLGNFLVPLILYIVEKLFKPSDQQKEQAHDMNKFQELLTAKGF